MEKKGDLQDLSLSFDFFYFDFVKIEEIKTT